MKKGDVERKEIMKRPEERIKDKLEDLAKRVRTFEAMN